MLVIGPGSFFQLEWEYHQLPIWGKKYIDFTSFLFVNILIISFFLFLKYFFSENITNGGISCLLGSSIFIGGACWAKAFSNSDIITARKFLMTSSKGFAPKARKLKIEKKLL